eukprot:764581-Hanusia_phi.AAC.9
MPRGDAVHGRYNPLQHPAGRYNAAFAFPSLAAPPELTPVAPVDAPNMQANVSEEAFAKFKDNINKQLTTIVGNFTKIDAKIKKIEESMVTISDYQNFVTRVNGRLDAYEKAFADIKSPTDDNLNERLSRLLVFYEVALKKLEKGSAAGETGDAALQEEIKQLQKDHNAEKSLNTTRYNETKDRLSKIENDDKTYKQITDGKLTSLTNDIATLRASSGGTESSGTVPSVDLQKIRTELDSMRNKTNDNSQKITSFENKIKPLENVAKTISDAMKDKGSKSRSNDDLKAAVVAASTLYGAAIENIKKIIKENAETSTRLNSLASSTVDASELAAMKQDLENIKVDAEAKVTEAQAKLAEMQNASALVEAEFDKQKNETVTKCAQICMTGVVDKYKEKDGAMLGDIAKTLQDDVRKRLNELDHEDVVESVAKTLKSDVMSKLIADNGIVDDSSDTLKDQVIAKLQKDHLPAIATQLETPVADELKKEPHLGNITKVVQEEIVRSKKGDITTHVQQTLQADIDATADAVKNTIIATKKDEIKTAITNDISGDITGIANKVTADNKDKIVEAVAKDIANNEQSNIEQQIITDKGVEISTAVVAHFKQQTELDKLTTEVKNAVETDFDANHKATTVTAIAAGLSGDVQTEFTNTHQASVVSTIATALPQPVQTEFETTQQATVVSTLAQALPSAVESAFTSDPSNMTAVTTALIPQVEAALVTTGTFTSIQQMETDITNLTQQLNALEQQIANAASSTPPASNPAAFPVTSHLTPDLMMIRDSLRSINGVFHTYMEGGYQLPEPRM